MNHIFNSAFTGLFYSSFLESPLTSFFKAIHARILNQLLYQLRRLPAHIIWEMDSSQMTTEERLENLLNYFSCGNLQVNNNNLVLRLKALNVIQNGAGKYIDAVGL